MKHEFRGFRLSLLLATMCVAFVAAAQQNNMVYTEFDSLKTNKIIFADSTELSSSLWTNNGTDISHDGDVTISSNSEQALSLNFGSAGISFSKALAGPGFGANSSTAMIYRIGSGFGSQTGVIRYSNDDGNKFLFYPRGTTDGFDPNSGVIGSPTLMIRNNGTAGVAIDTTYIPAGYKLAVNGATLTDSLTTDKISFSDGTSFNSAPTNFWTDNTTNISHDGDVVINSDSEQILSLNYENNFSNAGIEFSRAQIGSGLGLTPTTAINFRVGTSPTSPRGVIKHNVDGFLFYTNASDEGFDPNSGNEGTPALTLRRNASGDAQLAIDTTYVPSGYKLAVNGATLTDSLTTDKISFSDGTSFTSAPTNFWTDNGTDISHDGDVTISSNSEQALSLNFGSAGISFSKALAGPGFGANSSTAMIYRIGSGFGSQTGVIRYSNDDGNKFLFYPRGTTDGFDPNSGVIGRPTLMIKNNGTAGVAIDTTYIPAGYKLAVNGAILTDSLTTDKISFSDGTSFSTAPANLWTDNGTDISHEGDVVINSDSEQILSLNYEKNGLNAGIEFSRAQIGSGLGLTPTTAINFRVGTSPTSPRGVIKHNIDGFLFYTNASDEGFDPNSGNEGTPALTLRRNASGEAQLAIDTTYIPDGYKLAVNGDVIAEQVDVVLSQNWPDYVFEEGYQLKTLEQTDEFIQENGHLPGVESAEEMEEKGVMDLADMNLKLLEKVEELTLHLIDQNKQLKAVNTQLTEVQQLNKELADRIQKLEQP